MRQSEKSLLLIVLDPTDDSLWLDSAYLIFIYSVVVRSAFGPPRKSMLKVLMESGMMLCVFISYDIELSLCGGPYGSVFAAGCHSSLPEYGIHEGAARERWRKNQGLTQQNWPMPSSCQQDCWSRRCINDQKTYLFISVLSIWAISGPSFSVFICLVSIVLFYGSKWQWSCKDVYL